MEKNLSDLATTDDISKFLQHFYEELLVNPTVAPVFSGIDMQVHMPRVVAFWDGIVFGNSQYRGSPFDPHVPLALTSEHFSIWYETFCSCLDEYFEGPKATMVKERARSIAFIFCHKLELVPPAI